MSATLDQFFPWVLPSVPGCSDLLAQQAIRQACIEFCNRTDLVQRVTTADATAAVQDYTITPPTDMILSRILSVGWQGTLLSMVSPDVVNNDLALRGVAIGTATPLTGDPRWAFQKTPADSDAGFSIYPIPDTTVTLGLTVKASYAPTNAAATVDDALWNDYVEQIAAGAMARLMMMPGQTFSSKSGALYKIEFERAIERGRHQKNTGSLAADKRVMPVRFA